MLLFIIALLMLLFKQQAKQLLEALVKLVIALSNAIVNGMK